jgi:hydrogenase nickel incorporation protein HypB
VSAPADSHEHVHAEPGDAASLVRVEEKILAHNGHLAGHNRQWLDAHGILTVNLMSSPGSGKTTLLERTLRHLSATRATAVIEGDQETVFDAERIRATGAPVVQVNTGTGCHLDARMVDGALRQLDPPDGAILFVENVGNLVCPALFDLGEHAKVIIASVTEGADKPLKYPNMFRAGSLVLLNKIDLLPYVEFDVERFDGYVRQVNPAAEVIHLSATGGDGCPEWYAWLKRSAGTLPTSAPLG